MSEVLIRVDERVQQGKFSLLPLPFGIYNQELALRQSHDLPINQKSDFDMKLIYAAYLFIEEWIIRNSPKNFCVLVNPDDYENYPLEDIFATPYPEPLKMQRQ